MSDYFISEFIVEILLRLPVKSLVKCMSVCKAWKSLITSDTFISDHHTRTLHLQANHGSSSLFLQFRCKRDYAPMKIMCEEFFSLYSDDKKTHGSSVQKFPLTHLFLFGYSAVVGTCNGLVCLADHFCKDGANAVIWNPSIQKYVILPKPILPLQRSSCIYHHQVLFGFCFDSRNNDFKVVRVVTYPDSRAAQVEIYSLATRSWRCTTATVPPFVTITLLSPHMCVNGILHWVVKRISDGEVYHFILSFDVVEEKCRELMLPWKESYFQAFILPGGDALAVVCKHLNPNRFDIWVMKEYGAVESWTHLLHFDFASGHPSVLALSHGQVVLVFSLDEIILLDVKTQLRTKLITSLGYYNTFAGDYVDSLFLINE